MVTQTLKRVYLFFFNSSNFFNPRQAGNKAWRPEIIRRDNDHHRVLLIL